MSDFSNLPKALQPFFLGAANEQPARPAPSFGQAHQAAKPIELLNFAVAKEEFALPLAVVQEICVLGAITAVPRAPKETLGISSLRGEVVPVVDLAAVLGFAGAATVQRGARGVLLEDNQGPVALYVSAVRGVVRLAPKDVSAKPYGLTVAHPNLVSGLGRSAHGLVTILDGAALLQHLEHLL